MTHKMTEERLAELGRWAGKMDCVMQEDEKAAFDDMLDEIDRLRAENECYRALLAECAQYLGHKGTNAAAYDLFIRARGALNPEAAQ